MFEDEIQQLLAELVGGTGAIAAAIALAADPPLPVHPGDDPTSADAEPAELREVDLGSGTTLRLWFRTAAVGGQGDERGAAAERAARALRACARRWQRDRLPTVRYPTEPITPRARVRARIERYLEALAAAQNTANALVTLHGDIIGSARPCQELHRERVPFIVKRVAAEAGRKKGESSHATIEADDFFASSFWFDACLIIFFTGPYALDFVRHRARLVVREISGLMAELDPPPGDPAHAAPRPD